MTTVTTSNNRVSVVIATRNRSEELLHSVARLRALPERPALIVVDNNSDDGSADAVERLGARDTTVVRLDRNAGAAARNVGTALAVTSYVAFSDDDSWWAPGALTQAADVLDRHPQLALIAARVVVEPEAVDDPTCAQMAASPLVPRAGMPGRPVLGFLACGAVVRRSAFLASGGFPEAFGVGGEEAPLALALAARWELAYVDSIVAHHQPSSQRDSRSRTQRQARNEVWTAWLRLPTRAALRATIRVAARAGCDSAAWKGIVLALPTLPTVWLHRAVVPPAVAERWRTLVL